MLKHRALLKGVIDFSGDKKELPYILENYNLVHDSNIVFNVDIHNKIYDFVKDHSTKFVVVPSFTRVKKKFEEDTDILEELDKIQKESTLYSTNYRSLLEEVYIEQQKRELVSLMREVNEISETGKKLTKNSPFISGPKAAAEHFLHKSMGFLKSASSIKTQGSMKGDTKESVTDYYDSKNNKGFSGLLTGLSSIDLVCKGIRQNELWLMVAYVSELKTTMAMNFAYTQAIEQGKNIKFVSLEMPYRQVRDLFVSMHSANLNLWPGSEYDDVYPLNYDDIEEGNLSARQEEFLNFLCNDLDTNPEYGTLDIMQPEDGMTMAHFKAWAEIEYRKKPFDAIYLDYIELMKSESNKDYTLELNQRIKDLKQFCLHFDGGTGMRVISAYQANRQGKQHADKNDGEYRLDALSYANEAERSADVVIYSYLNDELRANDQNKIGCLKNRSRPKFKQFRAKTNLACRKVYEPIDGTDLTTSSSSVDVSKARKKAMAKEDLISSGDII